MFKMSVRVFLAVTILVSGLFVSTQPVQAGATIGGEITLHEGNSLSIFVQSTIHLRVWGYSGLISEQDFVGSVIINNLDEVQYFKLSPLNGENIDLSNNTQNEWNNRGDNTWHRADAQFSLYKAGDNRLWAMFTWSPFRDIRGSSTSINITIIFPEGINVPGFKECTNGCTKNLNYEINGTYGMATSWNVIPTRPGTYTIELEWQESGGIFPEHGSNTIIVQKNFETFLPLVNN